MIIRDLHWLLLTGRSHLIFTNHRVRQFHWSSDGNLPSPYAISVVAQWISRCPQSLLACERKEIYFLCPLSHPQFPGRMAFFFIYIPPDPVFLSFCSQHKACPCPPYLAPFTYSLSRPIGYYYPRQSLLVILVKSLGYL